MEGLQVPVIPSFEVVGNAGIVAPLQNGPTGAKVGVTFGVMVIVRFVGLAHSPAVGVNAYVVVAVLLMAGDQVPVIGGTLVDEVGNPGITAPLQKGPTGLKVGATGSGASRTTELS